MLDLKKETARVKDLMAKGTINIDDIHYGDIVTFNYFEKAVRGKVAIIDRQGGGIYYTICPSVDIQGDDGIFYKHVAIVDLNVEKDN